MAEQSRYQGAGSSHINPWKLVSATQACPEVAYATGCMEDGSTNDSFIQESTLMDFRNTKVSLAQFGNTGCKERNCTA